MNRLRAWLPFIALLVAAALIVTNSMKRDRQLATTPAAEEARQPVYVADGAVWTRYGDDGQPMIRAQAQRIDYFEDRSMTLDTVTLDRLGGAQNSWHLEAPRGIVPPDEQRMRLEPDVSVRGQTRGLPTTIAAREVWVDWHQKTIRSDQPVQARAPGRVATASGWESDFNATRVQMKGNVEMHYDAPRR